MYVAEKSNDLVFRIRDIVEVRRDNVVPLKDLFFAFAFLKNVNDDLGTTRQAELPLVSTRAASFLITRSRAQVLYSAFGDLNAPREKFLAATTLLIYHRLKEGQEKRNEREALRSILLPRVYS